MAQLDQYVNASADDYTEGDGASTTANELLIQNNFAFQPNLLSRGYCRIDTSSIPDDATIDSATFYWYDHSYIAGKGAGYSQVLWMWDEVSAYRLIWSSTATFVAGPKSEVLTATELGYIDKDGLTGFRFTIDDPAAGKGRTWLVRAWDGYAGSNEQPRLVVNYTEAGGRKKTMVLR